MVAQIALDEDVLDSQIRAETIDGFRSQLRAKESISIDANKEVVFRYAHARNNTEYPNRTRPNHVKTKLVSLKLNSPMFCGVGS